MKEHVEQERTHYNSQPYWSLNGKTARTENEAVEMVVELMRCIALAADRFWGSHCLVKGSKWRKHCWKHVTFDDLQDMADRLKAGTWPPSGMRLDLVGSHENSRDLFPRAMRCEPDAVARLEFLLPRKEDQRQAAKDIDVDLDREIPTVAEIASMWAQTAVRRPGSEEAREARSNLQRLVSTKAALGSGTRGRPSINLHEEGIVTAFIMAYGLFTQIRNVAGFLKGFLRDIPTMHSRLSKLYPGLVSHLKVSDIGLDNLLRSGPTESACFVAGRFLEMSASAVRKTAYRNHLLP